MTNYLLSISLKSLSPFKYAPHPSQDPFNQFFIAKCKCQKNKEKRLANIIPFSVLLLNGTNAVSLEEDKLSPSLCDK